MKRYRYDCILKHKRYPWNLEKDTKKYYSKKLLETLTPAISNTTTTWNNYVITINSAGNAVPAEE